MLRIGHKLPRAMIARATIANAPTGLDGKLRLFASTFDGGRIRSENSVSAPDAPAVLWWSRRPEAEIGANTTAWPGGCIALGPGACPQDVFAGGNSSSGIMLMPIQVVTTRTTPLNPPVNRLSGPILRPFARLPGNVSAELLNQTVVPVSDRTTDQAMDVSFTLQTEAAYLHALFQPLVRNLTGPISVSTQEVQSLQGQGLHCLGSREYLPMEVSTLSPPAVVRVQAPVHVPYRLLNRSIDGVAMQLVDGTGGPGPIDSMDGVFNLNNYTNTRLVGLTLFGQQISSHVAQQDMQLRVGNELLLIAPLFRNQRLDLIASNVTVKVRVFKLYRVLNELQAAAEASIAALLAGNETFEMFLPLRAHAMQCGGPSFMDRGFSSAATAGKQLEAVHPSVGFHVRLSPNQTISSSFEPKYSTRNVEDWRLVQSTAELRVLNTSATDVR